MSTVRMPKNCSQDSSHTKELVKSLSTHCTSKQPSLGPIQKCWWGGQELSQDLFCFKGTRICFLPTKNTPEYPQGPTKHTHSVTMGCEGSAPMQSYIIGEGLISLPCNCTLKKTSCMYHQVIQVDSFAWQASHFTHNWKNPEWTTLSFYAAVNTLN